MEEVKTKKKQGRISAKKALSRTVYGSKQQAQSEHFWDIDTNNDRKNLFKTARAIRYTNKYVTRENSVRDDKGSLTISDEVNLHSWKEHYHRLLNVEFPWNKNSLNNSAAVEELAIFVTEDMVTDVIKKMKQRKAGRPSGAIVEMITADERERELLLYQSLWIKSYDENIPEGWKDSFIINCYKGKGTIGASSSKDIWWKF